VRGREELTIIAKDQTIPLSENRNRDSTFCKYLYIEGFFRKLPLASFIIKCTS
jgi:hypothetical protein